MLLSYLLSIVPFVAAGVIYQPNETYAVHSTVKEVVDHSRSYLGQPWRVMTTTYYPIGKSSDCIPYLVPYMPALTAEYAVEAYSVELNYQLPSTIFSALSLQVCNSSSPAGNKRRTAWPLTILTSGAGAVRQIYSALAEELASRGYIVITLDDPGQALIIEYPDGSYISVTDLTVNTTAQIIEELESRTQDIHFVKQQALNGTLLPHHLKVDKSRVAVWGHSFGGAASAQATAEDPSPKGGVNFDGTLYGSVVQTGLDRPFMNFGRPGETNLSTWDEFLSHSDNVNDLVLNLKNVTHESFSDAPLIANVAGMAQDPGVSTVFTGLDGRRVLVILATYVDAFFRFSFGEGVSSILKGPSAAFPEVEFVSKPLVG